MSNDDFNLSEASVALIGLGLMGGSMALALRGKCNKIYGYDIDGKTLEIARRQNIVDWAGSYPSNLPSDLDLIILAAPVRAILNILDDLKLNTQNRCVILDLGSTKVDIVRKMAALPENFEPIGGHPICGKEKLTLENADRTLYYAAPFLLTPLERTTSRAISAAKQLIYTVGAKMEILKADEHDRILAQTSHLPFLVSSALVLSTADEFNHYIGPGYRSVSRLAGTPESMMLGVLLSNRDNIVAAFEKFQDELAFFVSAIIDQDEASLLESLKIAREKYLQLAENKQQ